MSLRFGRKKNAAVGRGVTSRVAAGVGTLAVCAIFPLFVNDAIGYVPLLMCVFVMALSYAYLRVCVRFIDCAQKVRYRECMRGEADTLTITLNNASPLVVFRVEAVFVIEDADGAEPKLVRSSTALAGKGEHSFFLDVGFSHVGTYAVGLRSVEVFDLLGLFSRVISVDERCVVRVLPRIWRIDRLNGSELTTTENVRSVRTTLSDDMDYAAVREYQLGDPMKTVHWKMSARGQDHLFTKLFESHTNPGTTVLLDFYSEEPDPQRRACMYDALLEASFSILDFARFAGIQTTLVFRDKRGVVRSTSENDPERLDALLDEMPRLSADVPRTAAADMLEGEVRNPDAQANFVFLTAELTRENVEAVIAHKGFRRGVRVMCVLPPKISSDERKRRLAASEQLRAANVSFSAIEEGQDIAKAVSA